MIDYFTFCINSLFLIIDEHWRASHCCMRITAHRGGTLDSFANATAKQINEGFSDGLFLLLAVYRQRPNVLTSVALDFTAIDFWVPRAWLYAIRLDFLLHTLSPSRSHDYFCKLLINRHASPESVATRKRWYYPWHVWSGSAPVSYPASVPLKRINVGSAAGRLLFSVWNLFPPSVIMIVSHHCEQKSSP